MKRWHRLDALFGGPVTGASMNPVGAIVGALAYQFVRGGPERPDPVPESLTSAGRRLP